jgi:hypothetical protein
MCRANGHIRHFYSVAQHCLNCAREAQARGHSDAIQLACLLHDASEAYISDITRPVKRSLPQYTEIEDVLQSLIFDNNALASHRAMAAILGVILRLPPLKQALASEQMKSVYLERLLAWGEKYYRPS